MALEGTFNDMPLTDLIAIFRIGLKSGILDVTGDTYHGSVYVSYGRLIDATVQEWPNQQELFTGDAAVIELLTWRSGAFVFAADATVIRRPVTIFLAGEELIQRSYDYTVNAVASATRAEMRYTVECAAIDNDAFSADLGGYQHQRQIPTRQYMWRAPSEALSRLAPAHDTAIAHDTHAPQPVLLERTANQPVQAMAIAAHSTPALNKAIRPAGRLLQAVIRRVRGL